MLDYMNISCSLYTVNLQCLTVSRQPLASLSFVFVTPYLWKMRLDQRASLSFLFHHDAPSRTCLDQSCKK